MSLGPSDSSKLQRILKLARKLEITWPAGDRDQLNDLSANALYMELKAELTKCIQAESESLSRLASGAVHLHDQVSLSHFYACVVPFERLSNQALRDDDFLVDEGDDLKRQVKRLPLKLVVENLRSSFNVGALFRTSECLGVSEILLCGYTSTPEDEKTARTSMGTSSVVPWRRIARAPEACEELRLEGYTLVALETAATATSLYDFKFDRKPVAFVVGNERFGVEVSTLQAVDAICRIPLQGIKNSMNVGVAFGVAGYEWLRQYRASPE